MPVIVQETGKHLSTLSRNSLNQFLKGQKKKQRVIKGINTKTTGRKKVDPFQVK